MEFKIMLIYLLAYCGLFSSIMLLFSLFDNRRKLDNPKPFYPLVSILIPAFNEEKTLSKTVESVLKLDYPREKLDIIIVDDGSTDKTLKIANSYKNKGIRVIHQKNSGKAEALNNALKHTKGEFVAALDADSFVMPDTLNKMIGYFRNKKVMAVAPSIKIWKPKGILQKVQQIEFLSATIIRKIFSTMGGVNLLPGPFGMVRKSFFDKYGGWNSHTITEDLELSLRIESKKKYLIETAIDASVYTLAAKTFKESYKQRLRWFKGYISNLINYRYMISRSYGNMGLFILPASIVSVFLALTLFMYSLIVGSMNFMKNIYKLYLTDFDITAWFEFNPDLFFVNTSGYMLLLAVLAVMTTYLIYIARKFDESEGSITLSYIYFVLTYWFFYAVCWLSAFFHMIAGREVRWEKGVR